MPTVLWSTGLTAIAGLTFDFGHSPHWWLLGLLLVALLVPRSITLLWTLWQERHPHKTD